MFEFFNLPGFHVDYFTLKTVAVNDSEQRMQAEGSASSGGGAGFTDDEKENSFEVTVNPMEEGGSPV